MSKTTPHHEQLALFPPSSVPERFRLDEATRRRGMRHVAELKARLEARYPSRSRRTSPGARATIGSRVDGRAA